MHTCGSCTPLWERSASPLCKEYGFQRVKAESKDWQACLLSLFTFLVKRAFRCKLKLSFIPLFEPGSISDFFSLVILCCLTLSFMPFKTARLMCCISVNTSVTLPQNQCLSSANSVRLLNVVASYDCLVQSIAMLRTTLFSNIHPYGLCYVPLSASNRSYPS